MIGTRIEVDGRLYFPFCYTAKEDEFGDCTGDIWIATRTNDAIAITSISVGDFFFEKFTCAEDFYDYEDLMNKTRKFTEVTEHKYCIDRLATAIISKDDGSMLVEYMDSNGNISYEAITHRDAAGFGECKILPEFCMNPIVIREDYTEQIGNYKYTLHSGNIEVLGWMVDIVDTDKYNPNDTIESRIHGLNVNCVNDSFGNIHSKVVKLNFTRNIKQLETFGIEFNGEVRLIDLTNMVIDNLVDFIHGLFEYSNVGVIINKDDYTYHYEDFIKSSWGGTGINKDYDVVSISSKDKALNTVLKRGIIGIKSDNVIFVA